MMKLTAKLAAIALSSVAASSAFATVPQPALHFDFEDVSGVTVPNLGTAGTAFNGTLTSIRTGPGFDNAVISTDSISGSGALQPTNLTETILGGDEGFYGGSMIVPSFNLVPNTGEEDFLGFTFAAWVKYGSNPNQSASNNQPEGFGWQMGLMANENTFPPDGIKLWVNNSAADNRDGDGNRRVLVEGGDGITPGGQASGFDALVDDGEYHHVAIVFDGNASPFVSEMDFYIDGVLSNPTPTSLQNQFEIGNLGFFEGELSFGAQNNAGAPHFGFGVMDDVMVWTNTALTPEQIAMLATPPEPGLAADFNGDGTVDLLDLDILGANFDLTPATAAQGDANGDGTVDLLDLDILGSQFGMSASSQAIPEPASLALVVLAGVAVATRRRC
ncbi:MAG: LamG-like jellyroll fold domain-containing protein [Planctomycetota bacterium]